MPGLYELLDAIKEKGIMWGVVTSAPRSIADRYMRLLEGDRRPDIMVTGDDITNGKPDPEPFLLASELAGISPEDCLVLEDAPAGIEAAYRAGMNPVMVPDKIMPSESTKRIAVSVEASLTDAIKYL